MKTEYEVKEGALRNIKSGLGALSLIANGMEEVPFAMKRKDLEKYGGTSEIMFVYGRAGDTEQSYKKGFGIMHIGAKHGPRAILRALNVIANGRIERVVEGNKTVILTDGEYEAVLALTRNGQHQSWLLTAWDKLPTDENGKVSTNTVSTQANPTFSRADLGAVVESAAKLIKDFKGNKFGYEGSRLGANTGTKERGEYEAEASAPATETGMAMEPSSGYGDEGRGGGLRAAVRGIEGDMGDAWRGAEADRAGATPDSGDAPFGIKELRKAAMAQRGFDRETAAGIADLGRALIEGGGLDFIIVLNEENLILSLY